MAGGPIAPHSIYLGGGSGDLFANVHAGAGGNASSHDEGIGVAASIAADRTAELRFMVPPSIPSGTMKLLLRALANATSGTANVTVKDAIVASGASPSAATLTSETQASITWAAGDNDKYKDAKVTLTPTPTANSELAVALAFNTTGWTLAQVSTWQTFLIWE